MDDPARVIREFERRFGRPPEWIARAPGRVNLIGEHVDYCGGPVLPMAIERATLIAAAACPATRGWARVFSTAVDEAVDLPLASGRQGGPIPGEGWPAYVRGVVAGFLDRGITLPAFDAVVDSTVPIGAGLSSSASLEVATAHVLEALSGAAIAPLERALLCQRAEHVYAGVPCGLMDQCASELCRAGHLLLFDCRSLAAEQVPFTRDDVVVLITDSGVRHALDDGGYAARRADCETAARLLGVPLLCAATTADVERAAGLLGPRIERRARHVVTEILRTLRTAAAIAAGRWQDVGPLMAASHASLRDDFEVSCPELDVLVELATRSPGVIGSRMTGGGFGGATVTLVEAARADDVMAGVRVGYRERTGRDCTAFATRPAPGASAWRHTRDSGAEPGRLV